MQKYCLPVLETKELQVPGNQPYPHYNIKEYKSSSLLAVPNDLSVIAIQVLSLYLHDIHVVHWTCDIWHDTEPVPHPQGCKHTLMVGGIGKGHS